LTGPSCALIIAGVAQHSLSDLIETIRSRVQAELDAQLPALTARHEEALAATRREVEAEAEQRAKELVAAARKDAEADAERRTQDLMAAVRKEVEVEAERRTQEAVLAARREGENEAERRLAALKPSAAEPISRTMVEAFSAIDQTTSISDTLHTLAGAASKYGAALFVGPEIERWGGGPAEPSIAPTSLLKDSLTATRALRRDGAVAAPLLLDGTAIAVLHANTSNDADADALEVLAHYGAARLGSLTATRILQAQGRGAARSAAASGNGAQASERKTEAELASDDDAVQSARRYARLLVSEIKLYNETAVNEGRAERDLGRRLGAEIERARRVYEQRVSSTVPDRARHFHHELVQTLAGGDPTLLG